MSGAALIPLRPASAALAGTSSSCPAARTAPSSTPDRPTHREAAVSPRDRQELRGGREGSHEPAGPGRRGPASEERHHRASGHRPWLEVAELEDTNRERYDDLIRLYVLPCLANCRPRSSTRSSCSTSTRACTTAVRCAVRSGGGTSGSTRPRWRSRRRRSGRRGASSTGDDNGQHYSETRARTALPRTL